MNAGSRSVGEGVSPTRKEEVGRGKNFMADESAVKERMGVRKKKLRAVKQRSDSEYVIRKKFNEGRRLEERGHPF